MSLYWHPRATHAPQQGTAVDFSEPSPPIYVDEAAISREEAADDATTSRADAEAALVEELADEALQVPEKDRLPAPWPKSGPLLDAAARTRVGAQLAQDRRELAALQDAGLFGRSAARRLRHLRAGAITEGEARVGGDRLDPPRSPASDVNKSS